MLDFISDVFNVVLTIAMAGLAIAAFLIPCFL